MESIKRLREYVNEKDRWGISHSHVQAINEIADAIEEEFKEQELAHAFAHSQVYEFASNLKGQLLDFDKMDEQQDAMAEHGWVKLPVDADGVTWNIGDRTESGQVVYKLYLDKHGWSFYGLVNDIDPAIHRHYHAPTVEDVLSEMIDEWVMADSTEDEEAVVVECAKKLRLKEEA